MFGKQIQVIRNESGSVLLAALAILSILAISISAVLFYGGWQRKQGFVYLDEMRARSLAESGLHYALAELSENLESGSSGTNVVLDSLNMFDYRVVPWGGYLKLVSKGTGAMKSYSLSSLVGTEAPDFFDHLLIQIGNRYPLVISGRTSLVGNIYVSPAGITRGEINGRGYERSQLVDGRIDTFMTSTPQINSSVLRAFLESADKVMQCTEFSDYSIQVRDHGRVNKGSIDTEEAIGTRATIEFNLPDSMVVGTPKFYFAEKTIQIRGYSRLENVVLHSHEVILTDNCNLDGCIIVAEVIKLTGECRFNGQLIARDTINIESRAKVEQPSLLILTGRAMAKRLEGLVDISSTESTCATIVNARFELSDKPDSVLEVACVLRTREDSPLMGLLWWEGLAEIHGPFAGAAAVNLFSHYVPPTTYMNWLVDADFRYSSEPQAAVFPLLSFEYSDLTIAGIHEERRR